MGTAVAAMTTTRNEGEMVRRWVRYYGDRLGRDALVVLDDNSTDGSTDDLGCTVVPLPPEPWKDRWLRARCALQNAFAGALLEAYDAVLYADVDEYVVPDPARYADLRAYLDEHTDAPAVAPVGLNLLHDAATEPPFDQDRPVLRQRRLVKLAPNMCKPLIKRRPLDWGLGTHAVKTRFAVDTDLLLLHLKYYDDGELRRVADLRRAAHESLGRGGSSSAWSLGGDELSTRLRSWVSDPDPPELDTSRLEIPRLQRNKELWSVPGTQLWAMEEMDLFRLPSRFEDVGL